MQAITSSMIFIAAKEAGIVLKRPDVESAMRVAIAFGTLHSIAGSGRTNVFDRNELRSVFPWMGERLPALMD